MGFIHLFSLHKHLRVMDFAVCEMLGVPHAQELPVVNMGLYDSDVDMNWVRWIQRGELTEGQSLRGPVGLSIHCVTCVFPWEDEESLLSRVDCYGQRSPRSRAFETAVTWFCKYTLGWIIANSKEFENHKIGLKMKFIEGKKTLPFIPCF